MTVGDVRYCYQQLRKKEEEDSRKKEVLASKIQSFFRIITAKNIANRLRMEPHNLFEPEFSERRKIILKIDDSRFQVNKCVHY